MYWWIGARVKNGAMHWTHSNIKVSFWPPGRKDTMNGNYECGYAGSMGGSFLWEDTTLTGTYLMNPICQIN